MVQLASFLNRSFTDEFRPAFEIVYTVEATLLIFNFFLLPQVAWIAVNGVPLHRNLRYIMACGIFHGWIGVIARGILLSGQIFGTHSIEWEFTLGVASFFRRIFFIFFGVAFFGITLERFVATRWWSWYEKQKYDTIFVLKGIIIVLEVVSVQGAYMETFGATGNKEYAPIVFTVFAIIVATGGVIYISLLGFNIREVTKLSQRGANQYSLARVYQLRENVAVMKMLLRLVAPLGVVCIPIFIFMGAFIFLPPHLSFLRLFSMAMFDLWTAVVTLFTALFFPLLELRFRRPAFRLRIYRLLMPTRIHEQEKITKQSRATASQQYFDWLNRDLV